MKFDLSNKFDLLWASKFVAAKIKCSFEIGKCTPLRVTLILLAMVPIAVHNLLIQPRVYATISQLSLDGRTRTCSIHRNEQIRMRSI